jgi:archaeosine-15-forming tRNA-guanine transglycosylase
MLEKNMAKEIAKKEFNFKFTINIFSKGRIRLIGKKGKRTLILHENCIDFSPSFNRKTIYSTRNYIDLTEQSFRELLKNWKNTQ